MKWNKIESTQDLDNLVALSHKKPVLIFKHSTRCSISSMALNRLERDWKEHNDEQITPYYLDLINHRNISSTISEKFNIIHESPQVLIIKSGECCYNNSHMGINLNEIITEAN